MIADEASAKVWVHSLPECDAAARVRLDQFVKLLTQENFHQNLVSSDSLGHVWQRHIADSAQLLQHVPRETGKTWLDLGTGAGFPGMIIAILRPDIEISMVESRPRRAEWLNRVSSELNLGKSRVLNLRIELIETQIFSAISARAFAPLGELLKLSARFSDASTQWLLPKGRSAAHELQALSGWQHMFHVEQSLTDRDAGLIVGQLIGKAEHSR